MLQVGRVCKMSQGIKKNVRKSRVVLERISIYRHSNDNGVIRMTCDTHNVQSQG